MKEKNAKENTKCSVVAVVVPLKHCHLYSAQSKLFNLGGRNIDNVLFCQCLLYYTTRTADVTEKQQEWRNCEF